MSSSFLSAAAGGALIGLAASLLLVLGRETAGISGILEGVMRPQPEGRRWRVAFLAGLLVGGLVLLATSGQVFGPATRPLGLVAAAGLLVGFGTRMSGGCTSGHGVCGIARLSLPSLLAVMTFIAAGAGAVLALRVAGAGAW
jgi:uncharacterized membrane protein YedE/YeeE